MDREPGKERNVTTSEEERIIIPEELEEDQFKKEIDFNLNRFVQDLLRLQTQEIPPQEKNALKESLQSSWRVILDESLQAEKIDEDMSRVLESLGMVLPNIESDVALDLITHLRSYVLGEKELVSKDGKIDPELEQYLLSLREQKPDAYRIIFDSLRNSLLEIETKRMKRMEQNYLDIKSFELRVDRSFYLENPKYRELLKIAARDFTEEGLIKNGILKKVGDKYDIDRPALKRLITRRVYEVLSDLHANMKVQFDKSPAYREVSAYLGMLQGWIDIQFHELSKKYFKDNEEVVKFLEYISSNYPLSLQSLAAIFHQVPMLLRSSEGLKQIPQLASVLYPSELAVFLDDTNEVLQIGRYVISEYLRTRLVKEKNIMPSDLFSGEYSNLDYIYSFPDVDKIRKTIKEVAEKTLNRPVEDWEVNMADIYGRAIGMITLIDPEIIASSDPRPDPKGIVNLVSILAPHHWALGRARSDATPFAHLFYFNVPLEIERRSSRMRKWIPEKYAKAAEEKYLSYKEMVFDKVWGLSGQYYELMRLISLPISIVSRGGWRVSEHRKHVESIIKNNREIFASFFKDNGEIKDTKEWSDDEWEAFFAITTQELGVSAMWWWISDLTAQKEDLALEEFFKSKHYSDEEKAKIKSLIKKQKFFDPMFDIVVDGKVEKVSYFRLKESFNYISRGRVFEKYLYRNPGDFLMILSQITPEILSSPEVFLSEEELKSRGFDKKKIKQISNLQGDLRAMWGDKNFFVLKQVSDWFYNRIIPLYQSNSSEEISWQEAVDRFSQDMLKAFQIRLKKISELGRPATRFDEVTLKPEDLEVVNPDLVPLIFGSNGLVNLFPKKGLEGFGDPASFFPKMAQMWFKKEADMNPFGVDVNTANLVKYFGKVGEDVLARLTGDQWSTYEAITQKLVKFTDLFTTAAKTGDLSEFIELQKEIKSFLKNTMGSDYANRANYILSSLIISFFGEHSSARKSWGLVNGLMRMFYGKKVSISKIVLDDPDAYSMDTEEINDYLIRLQRLGILKEFGPWSVDQLRLAWDTEVSKVIADKAASIAQFIFLAMILAMILGYWKGLKGEEKK